MDIWREIIFCCLNKKKTSLSQKKKKWARAVSSNHCSSPDETCDKIDWTFNVHRLGGAGPASV